ncbi:hypothetical protein PR003_g6313 [Phytophthora rubi]|uniref:Uncharacterized protein n=1 Tax=Phytophthora rubi TaxID=129364 RepID=A0A6A3ND06_9STRA|nr:hypothetical protein PR001_g6598 [Phytophthora rubi]KAE9348638.1 hypothetical protein PR003_g6313 [Phytophthora rubi]
MRAVSATARLSRELTSRCCGLLWQSLCSASLLLLAIFAPGLAPPPPQHQQLSLPARAVLLMQAGLAGSCRADPSHGQDRSLLGAPGQVQVTTYRVAPLV